MPGMDIDSYSMLSLSLLLSDSPLLYICEMSVCLSVHTNEKFFYKVSKSF